MVLVILYMGTRPVNYRFGDMVNYNKGYEILQSGGTMTIEKDYLFNYFMVFCAQLLPARCLESILNQSCANLQIICINDGSTDLTQQILTDYSSRDTRIQHITQDNQGISAARNAGVKMATGDYIAFVDADDWLESDALENVLNDHQED
ncbi:hypothetical protein OSTOST_14193, partial [Ostertagia ostertagi]